MYFSKYQRWNILKFTFGSKDLNTCDLRKKNNYKFHCYHDFEEFHILLTTTLHISFYGYTIL